MAPGGEFRAAYQEVAFIGDNMKRKSTTSVTTGTSLPFRTGRSANIHNDEARLWSTVIVAEAHARVHAYSFALERYQVHSHARANASN